MPRGQELASLREGKLLWKTYIGPLKRTQKGWKCTLTGAGTGAWGRHTPLSCQSAASPQTQETPLSTGHGLRIKKHKPDVAGMECMDFPSVVEREQQEGL